RDDEEGSPAYPVQVGFVFLSRPFKKPLGILLGIRPAFLPWIALGPIFHGGDGADQYPLPTWSSPKRKPSAIAPLYRFKSEAEAIKMANDTEVGLASYFY